MWYGKQALRSNWVKEVISACMFVNDGEWKQKWKLLGNRFAGLEAPNFSKPPFAFFREQYKGALMINGGLSPDQVHAVHGFHACRQAM